MMWCVGVLAGSIIVTRINTLVDANVDSRAYLHKLHACTVCMCVYIHMFVHRHRRVGV